MGMPASTSTSFSFMDDFPPDHLSEGCQGASAWGQRWNRTDAQMQQKQCSPPTGCALGAAKAVLAPQHCHHRAEPPGERVTPAGHDGGRAHAPVDDQPLRYAAEAFAAAVAGRYGVGR